MTGGTLTPLAPLTMQELKLSQTLDGANMSPYHTTGELTSFVILQKKFPLLLFIDVVTHFFICDLYL